MHCPDHVITAVIMHTLESVMQYKEGAHIHELSEELQRYTFGCEGPGQCPVYEYFKVRNDHSVKKKDLPKGSPDGSYNLTGTNQKGQGQGCFTPAVQTATPEAKAHFSHILQLLNKIRQLIFSISLSKFENKIVEFYHEDNNTFGAGGLKPSGTGVQTNVSSIHHCITITGNYNLQEDLWKSIGVHQGGPHTDKSDDCTQNTLGVMMLRLPKGKCL
jgi:hypothetical protein